MAYKIEQKFQQGQIKNVRAYTLTTLKNQESLGIIPLEEDQKMQEKWRRQQKEKKEKEKQQKALEEKQRLDYKHYVYGAVEEYKKTLSQEEIKSLKE